MELSDEQTLRKIRLAYTMGSMREIFEQEAPVPSVACGDRAMFAIPLEMRARIIVLTVAIAIYKRRILKTPTH